MNDAGQLTKPGTAGGKPGDISVTASKGLGGWLARNKCSIAFTTYQSGRVCTVGLAANGAIAFQEQMYARALGLAVHDQTMWVASLSVLWRLENVLTPGEVDDDRFDRVYQPRVAYITGDVDAHEVAVDRAGRPIFVNTKYSCLATVSTTHNFEPLWKPNFISKLLPEDRCHLNGVALENGEPVYVTAISRSDIVEGWRTKRSQGGILVDVRDDRIVSEGISIPHSPRVHDGRILLLESGRGQLVSVDPQSGAREDIAFCPGFLRGLAVHGDYALVTTSCPRDGAFEDLELDDALKARNIPAQCGVYIVDVRKRAVVEMLTFGGALTELFDVAVLPGVKCPAVEGPATPALGSRHAVAPFAGR